MTRRTWWTIGFLGITALAVGAELLAALDHDASTAPWTEYLVSLPWWVTMPAALVLSVWLPLHLARWYRLRRHPTQEEVVVSQARVPNIVPPTTGADARNRALRTLAQGLLVDVTVAMVLAVGPALADQHFAWTAPYWITIGLLASKSAVQTAVAYAARHLVPPRP